MPDPATPHPDPGATPCPHTGQVGSFLLCALSKTEREDFAGHLDTCPRCQAEVDSLIPVVFALDTINWR